MNRSFTCRTEPVRDAALEDDELLVAFRDRSLEVAGASREWHATAHLVGLVLAVRADAHHRFRESLA